VSDFPESHRDLLDAPVGILSTVGDTGIPHTTAIWFLHDLDGELKSWLSDARQKVKNLQKRPEFSFFILDIANPARYLTVRGRAALTPDPECAFGDRLGRKYNTDVRRMLREDETRYVVTFKPLKVLVR
jgi:PPOX class probable F420-dependent enzyme